MTDEPVGSHRRLDIEINPGDTERLLLAAGVPAAVVDDYTAFRRRSYAAVGDAARGHGKSTRALRRAVLAVVRCPVKGHNLASIQRTAAGVVLWPTVSEPESQWMRAEAKIAEDRRPVSRDAAPSISGHYMVGRGHRAHLDARGALLLDVPESTRGWIDWTRPLWCRCGEHTVDALELSEHFRVVGTRPPPKGQSPTITATRKAQRKP